MNTNIDKMAIGVAALIIVGLIGFALFSSDEVATAVDEIQEYNQTINEKSAGQDLPSAAAPKVLDDIKPQFTGLDESAQFAPWVWYRRPGQVSVTGEVAAEPPVHEGPRLTKIEQRRDKDLKQPVHVVHGTGPSLERASSVRSVVVSRKVGTEAWAEVGAVRAAPDSFEIQVTGLELGAEYEYKVVSVAKSESQKSFPSGQMEDTLESGTYSAPVPHDLVWRFSSLQEPDLQRATGGGAMVTRRRWSYDDDEIKTDREHFDAALKTSDIPGLPKIFDTGWRLARVEKKKRPGGEKSEWRIELRNLESGERHELWVKDEDMKSLEADDVMGDPEVAEGDEEAAADESAAAEEESTTPTPPPAPSGDDDDF